MDKNKLEWTWSKCKVEVERPNSSGPWWVRVHGPGVAYVNELPRAVAERLIELQADSDELAKIMKALRAPSVVVEVPAGLSTPSLLSMVKELRATVEILTRAHTARLDIHDDAIESLHGKIADGWLNAFQVDKFGEQVRRVDLLAGEIQTLAANLGGLLDSVGRAHGRLDRLERQLDALVSTSEADRRELRSLAMDQLPRTRSEVTALEGRLDALEPAVGQIGIEVQRLEDGKVLERLDALEGEVRDLEQHDTVRGQQIDKLHCRIDDVHRELRDEQAGANRALVDLRERVDSLNARVANLDSLAVNNDVRLGALEAGEAQQAGTAVEPAAEESPPLPPAMPHDNVVALVRAAVHGERDRAIRLVTETVGDQREAQALIQKLMYPEAGWRSVEGIARRAEPLGSTDAPGAAEFPGGLPARSHAADMIGDDVYAPGWAVLLHTGDHITVTGVEGPMDDWRIADPGLPEQAIEVLPLRPGRYKYRWESRTEQIGGVTEVVVGEGGEVHAGGPDPGGRCTWGPHGLGYCPDTVECQAAGRCLRREEE